jgi:predicted Rossmann fold nucleotide-binding protein DprA/Smf involved in DNA uptake
LWRGFKLIRYDCKGNEKLLIYNHHRVGIIGSRKVTSRDLYLAFARGMEVSSKFNVVVTGMANGVDTWAMVGALYNDNKFAKNLRHIAVIPSIDNYGLPANNESLIEEILSKEGLVIAPSNPVKDGASMYLRRNDLLLENIDELITVGELQRGASYTERKAREKGIKVTNL